MKQIALALQKEINALEQNGIKIIQVDEPALQVKACRLIRLV